MTLTRFGFFGSVALVASQATAATCGFTYNQGADVLGEPNAYSSACGARDAASFLTLYGGPLALEDFEDLTGAAAPNWPPAKFWQPVGATSNEAGSIAPGQVAPGVRFTVESQDGASVNAPAFLASPVVGPVSAGDGANPSYALGVNWPTAASWLIEFSVPVNAFSLDLFQRSSNGLPHSDLARITLFGETPLHHHGVFELTGELDLSGRSGAFFGVHTGPSAWITSVRINNPAIYEVIDNVRFGLVPAPVPEPASVALMLGGLALLASRRRRR